MEKNFVEDNIDDFEDDIVIQGGDFYQPNFGEKKSQTTTKYTKHASSSVEKHHEHYGESMITSKEPVSSVKTSDEISTNSTENDPEMIQRIRQDGERVLLGLKLSVEDSGSDETLAQSRLDPTSNDETKPAVMTKLSTPIVMTGGTFHQAHIGPTISEQNFNIIVNQDINESHTHHHHYPPTSITEEESAQNAHAFLERCTIHLNKMIKDVRGQHITSKPTMMVLDMEGKKRNMTESVIYEKTNTLFGQDLEKIELLEIHEPFNEKPTRHAMILGDAGAGKTTLSKMYSTAAINHELSVGAFELIHYVNAYHLQTDSKSTAFALLFTQQMAGDPDTELDEDMQTAGLKWIRNNQENVLLTIDGLDQCSAPIGGKRYPCLDYSTRGKCDSIIANVMSGRIWPKVRILTTSRWCVYWNLMTEQKPDKVIGLRGFDDDNLEKAVVSHIPETGKCDSLLNYLKNNSSNTLELCRNPMFLIYAAEAFLTDPENLPDSMSGLMTAVFLKLYHSDHTNDPSVFTLTKLAYDGMQRNCYEFSSDDFKALGVNPEEFSGFITTGACLQPQQILPKSCDKSYLFTHQSMQEFCAAIHVLNFDPEVVERLVADCLNADYMETTRQLLYGVILNDSNTEQLGRHLKNKACSVANCREILLNQLRKMMPNGALNDIRLVKVVNESGDDTIFKLKAHINSIRIEDFNVPKYDQIILVSMIKKCSPLNDVYVQQFNLNPTLLKLTEGCHEQVGKYQAGYEIEDSINLENISDVTTRLEDSTVLYVDMRCRDCVKNELLARFLQAPKATSNTLGAGQINQMETLQHLFQVAEKNHPKMLLLSLGEDISMEILSEDISLCLPRLEIKTFAISDNSLTPGKVGAYMKLFKLSQSGMLRFNFSELTMENATAFRKACMEQDVQIKCMALDEGPVHPKMYQEVASIIKQAGCRKMYFLACNLDIIKLSQFRERSEKEKLSLLQLHIRDRFMTEECFGELVSTLNHTRCQKLTLHRCELNKAKLENFWKSCLLQHIELAEIHIYDDVMSPEGFEEIASTVRVTGCKHLLFGDCDLDKFKLLSFRNRCAEEGVHLPEFIIKDNTMDEDGYDELASTLHVVDCKVINLENCDLNKSKLVTFWTGCQRANVQLADIIVWDKVMDENGFRELSSTASATKCNRLFFGDCNLDRNKLSGFRERGEEDKLVIPKLQIRDKIMDEEAYDELASTLRGISCRILDYENCDLNQSRLSSFRKGCERENVKLTAINIWDSFMKPEGYREVASIVRATKCQRLLFGKCDLDKNKISQFREACQEDGLVLEKLHITDKNMDEATFVELPSTVEAAKCSELRFVDCNLTESKIRSLWQGSSEKEIKLQELAIMNETMDDDAYGALALALDAMNCPQLSLLECDLTGMKIYQLLSGCELMNRQIPMLLLENDEFLATEELVMAVCELALNVVSHLEIRGWIIDDDGIRRLEETLHLPYSKVIALELPNESLLCKGGLY